MPEYSIHYIDETGTKECWSAWWGVNEEQAIHDFEEENPGVEILDVSELR